MRSKFKIALFLLCFVSISVVAQKTEEKNSSQRITSKTYLENLVKENNQNNYVITSEHVSSTSGIKHTYIRQAIGGIEVVGTESSLHTTIDGRTISAHVNFIDAIENTVRGNRSAGISAEQAIQRVAQQMGYGQTKGLTEVTSKDAARRTAVYTKAGISGSEIPVQLAYYYQEGIGTSLVWELSIEELHSADWWTFRVDASTGTIIDKINLTISCLDNTEHTHGAEEVCYDGAHSEETPIYTVQNETAALVGSYNVIALPDESPQHGSTGRQVIANPDNATASPFGWHDTNGVAGAESEYTFGNNTDAYDDITSTVTGTGSGVDSERAFGGAGLVFNDTFNPVWSSGSDTNRSIDAAVTNLFYWANVIHDVMYLYGFDEASGNFQLNNYGNGGVAGDAVRSEAQDGSGTCNANFSTPTDGGQGRMQMYVCGSRDGDFDNGVIVHEYGHGISTRLTGGAGNSSCLQNQEQMGEGWSDYFGLIMTIDPGDLGTDPRGIGTWLLGEGPTGAGIRTQRYDTDTNTYTYDSIKVEVAPHGVGSVWSMMLWEMTWELIGLHGIDNNIYNFTGSAADAGNVRSLALVIEGLKLQPCSPGFIDGRDAILAADQALYGGANECDIWAAFARRGLGFSADQGVTSSKADGTEAFDLPVAGLSLTQNSYCISEGTIAGLAGGTGYVGGGTYSGPGVTDNGGTFTFDAAAAGIGTHTITYTDATCAPTTMDTDTITVTDGTPVLVCQDVTVTLDGAGNASIMNSDVIANLPIVTDYIEETIPFAPIANTGTGVALGDDNGTAAIPLVFDFEFYGTTYSNFYIASNGWLSFLGTGMTGAASRTSTALPTSAIPNGMIAGVWDDLDPGSSGTVTYQIIGSAPDRKLLVDFVGVQHWNAPATTVTFQIQLHETSNRIEIHYTDAQNNGGARTAGIENAAGDDGLALTGKSNSSWTATNESYALYIPSGQDLPDNCGNPVAITLSQSAFTCRDIGDNVITVTADDGNGGVATCNATVTVIGETTTYTGAWDNGVPDFGKQAVFAANYNTSTADIDACSCVVGAGAIVIVGADDYMNIDGNITVDGTLTVFHTGNVVQVNDAATVTNNGTINVFVDTPALDGRDFMLMGSPMSAETRADVFTGALRVRNHLTGNFTPNAAVAATSPGAGNWVDEEGDDWPVYAGAITPGEGYMVLRSLTGPATALSLNHNTGTLNNGVVTYTAGFNGTQNGSPSVIANPYASAMSATDFINGNANVDAVYFWEHVTAPSSGTPGPYGLDYTMEDISIFNLTGGTSAAGSDPSTTPNGIISTGQGFGIKALAGGDVTFNNAMRRTTGNTTLRISTDRDRIWLNVQADRYELNGTALIGFMDEATDGIDVGYDSRRLANNVSLFSHLTDGSDQLGIQARGAFQQNVKIAMGFSTLVDETISYTISIENIEGSNLGSQTVYLIDNQEETITNLSDTNYTFVSGQGIFDGRFTLQFTPESILGTTDVDLENITIYPNPTQNILNIVSPKAVVTAVEVYDVRGRVVSEVSFNTQGNYQVDLSSLESAMYFVKVTTDSGTITKRVVKQ